MTRPHMPAAMPAELAEKLSDSIGWGDARAAEVAYEIWVEEEVERLMKDSGWWNEVLEGLAPTKTIAFYLSEIYRNLGNTTETRDLLSKMFHDFYNIARNEVEDR